MKSFSVGLQAELMRSTARLATCMRVGRTDGNVYGFTTNRKALIIAGVKYAPASSFNPSDIASANNLEADDLQIEGLLQSEAITEDDLRAGRWDFAAFRIFQVNWSDLSQGEKKDRCGNLGEVKVNRQTFVTELLGLMDAYSISIGEITQPQCRANLGDQRCKVVLAGSPTMIVTGTITSAVVSGTGAYFRLNDTARTEDAGFFDEGIVTLQFIGGDISYEVKEYTPGTWTTKTPIAYDATGIAYTMQRGCRKRFIEDCRDTFNNAANFRGEPWLRGTDALVQIGRRQ